MAVSMADLKDERKAAPKAPEMAGKKVELMVEKWDRKMAALLVVELESEMVELWVMWRVVKTGL